jgi:hypothetical protein
MSMTTNDIFNPEVATDAIIEGVAGAKVLFNSPAVIVQSDLETAGALKVARKVTVPYFGMIPPFQAKVPEGAGLQPDKSSETVEEAPMYQYGVAIEWSKWSEAVLKGRRDRIDPYIVFAGMVGERFREVMEQQLILTARDGLGSEYINDISGNSPGTISWDSIVDTRYLGGDEANDIQLMSVHSKVKKDMLKLKDGEDRPLLIDAMNPNQGDVPRIQGVTVYTSDLNYKSSDSPPKYDSLMMERNSLVLWHSNPTIEPIRDGKANMNSIVCWFWAIVYRYKKLPGKTRGGVRIHRSK